VPDGRRDQLLRWAHVPRGRAGDATTASGARLPDGTRVTIQPVGDEWAFPPDTTTRGGRYELSGLGAGEYRLFVGRSRYGPVHEVARVVLPEAETVELDIIEVVGDG
jgi:hypothetical protein